MDDKQLELLKSKNVEQVKQVLENFNKENAAVFDLSKFRDNNQWHTIWKCVFEILNDTQLSEIYSISLNTIRILTRDRKSLEENNISMDCNSLMHLANLSSSSTQMSQEINKDNDEGATSAAELNNADIIVEALKCLCNLVYQSASCRRHCVKKNAADALLRRVVISSAPTVSSVELYDLKLLFLLTAMDNSARSRLQIDLNGVAYMTEWLDEKLHMQEFSTEQLEIICEMLKIMFNTSNCAEKSPDENEIQSLHLVVVLREVLLRFGSFSKEGEINVISHTINLLTNIWGTCLSELLCKCGSDEDEGSSNARLICFEGWNVKALDVILNYLRQSLSEQANAATATTELISPILTVLVKCARSSVVMRHYIRSIILPPLRKVSHRPEVGTELRNHLCRFLTLPDIVLRDLSAELLFVCCKENVARMIKYTGFGNAAGLFANRGLLDCRRVENADYSSDSENSDTEEYCQVQHSINPVIGCSEPPKINPFEGMSEEQKEYEAMQLVELMDKLHRSGITPARIGEDGRPQPVDHILQLQEELPQQQHEQKRKT